MRPRSVNLRALPTRLNRIWRTRVGIADQRVVGAGDRSRRRASAPSPIGLPAGTCRRRPRPGRTARTRSPPAPAGRPRSSRSRAVVDDAQQRLRRLADGRDGAALRAVEPCRSSTSIMPSTPFIGVRISWLMVARKVDFAWLAASASARSVSAASRAASAASWRRRAPPRVPSAR